MNDRQGAQSTPDPAKFWDDRYRATPYLFGEAPAAYLVAQRSRFEPGMRALVPADGEGRNGVWLAEQGLIVHTVDISPVGLDKACALAERRGVEIRAELAELSRWSWPRAAYDLVFSGYFHVPSSSRQFLHTAMAEALSPGGLLIIEAFHIRQLGRGSGGPPVHDMLYAADMLRADFAALICEELSEADRPVTQGSAHQGLAAVVQGVFRHPG